MDKHNQFEGNTGSQDAYLPLAQWLQDILTIPTLSPHEEQASLHESGVDNEYHLAFYQQLPDFVGALLNNDTQATLRFAPLFYHLIGCAACHTAYLETYDAMRAAVTGGDGQLLVDNGTHSPAITPPRTLVHLCQVLISQARAVLKEARHDHVDNDVWARSLLQQALRMSSHIMQSTLRQRALQNLVEVATLYIAIQPDEQGPAAHTYTSLVASGSGTRKGKTRRRAEMLGRPMGEPVIDLQSGSLVGLVTQHEDTLELHLQDLDASLRGHYVLVSVPLGSILEPVRWLGGNPHAIRSQSPVNERGSLKTPIGKTELRLTDAEDHNLLEAMFKKLDVRPTE